MQYALYKEDDLLAIGTKEEIAKEMGVLKSTIQFYMTPSQYKRTRGKGRILIPIEEDDHEDR